MPNHVFENLLRAAAEKPEHPALEFRGETISFAALALGARKLASGLAALELGPGRSVGLMLPNLPQFPEALYGAWLNGNVVVPMNVLLTAPEVRYLVEDSQMRALFVFEMFLPQVEAAIAELPNPPIVVVIGNPGRHLPYNALLTAHTPAKMRKSRADERILIIYTSGTTGKPKGAVITNENLIAQLDITDDLFQPEEDDRTLCVLPLFHVFALNGILNSSIRHRT